MTLRSRLGTTLAAVMIAVAPGTAHAATIPLPPQSGDSTGVTRLGGSDRYRTAQRVYEQRRDLLPGTTAVLARGDAFPDALSGTPLAAAVRGPLLTTGGASLSPAVTEAVTTGGITRVYVVGGPGSLSDEMLMPLTRAGVDVVRVFGADRFATSLAVAREVERLTGNHPLPCFIASGMSFPDALASGAAAGAVGGVVLLSRDSELPADIARFLDSGSAGRLYGVGGAGDAALAARGYGRISVVGRDRFDTAVTLATRVFTRPAATVMASGLGFGDALPGGALAAARRGPLLLTGGTRLDPGVATYVSEHMPTVDVIGGPASVSDSTFTEVDDARTHAPWLSGVAPRFVAHPQDLYGGIVGERMEIQVLAVGDYATSVEWFRIEVDGTRRSTGRFGPRLVFDTLRDTDSGIYIASAKNRAGQAWSTPTRLDVGGDHPAASWESNSVNEVARGPIMTAGSTFVAQAIPSTAWGRYLPAVIEAGSHDVHDVVAKGDYRTDRVRFVVPRDAVGRRYETVLLTEDGEIVDRDPRPSFLVVE